MRKWLLVQLVDCYNLLLINFEKKLNKYQMKPNYLFIRLPLAVIFRLTHNYVLINTLKEW